MTLTPKRLDRHVTEILDPILVPAGFSFRTGVYERKRGPISDGIGIDFDTRSRQTFRVLLGVDAPALSPDTPQEARGFIIHAFLRGNGVGAQPRNWRCTTDGEARESVKDVARWLENTALPWFSRFITLVDLAAELPPHEDYRKGMLYLAAGARVEASEWLGRYKARLEQMPVSPDVAQAIRAVEKLLGRKAE
jgi:hypothetical protein